MRIGSKHSEESKKRIRISKLGHPLSEDHKSKISESHKKIDKPWLVLKGKKSPHWKGDNVGYRALHYWVQKTLGKPKKCSFCDIQNKLGNGGRSTIQWANKDHKYKRKKEDWIALCYKCHYKYDVKYNKKYE